MTAAEKFAQFLDSPFAQLAMAKAGQMSALSTTAAAEVKATPYHAVFAQQLRPPRSARSRRLQQARRRFHRRAAGDPGRQAVRRRRA